MEEGSDYYVVRKGDVVAVYKTLSDCQAQICSSVCVTVWNYKCYDDCICISYFADA
jgi:viroplasmin and RNaseH domain-containing protein